MTIYLPYLIHIDMNSSDKLHLQSWPEHSGIFTPLNVDFEGHFTLLKTVRDFHRIRRISVDFC